MKFPTILPVFALALASCLTVQAQNDILYAMRGNPQSYFMNPAADVDSRVHVAFPSVNLNAQFSLTASQLIGAPLPEMWRQLSNPYEGIHSQVDVHLLNVGWKYKKSAYWIGSQVNTDVAAYFDHDLVDFILWGMNDANGDINLSYAGNFDQTSVVASARTTTTIGWQRQWNEKFKLGLALNATNLVGHAELRFDELSLASFPTSGAFNRLQLNALGSLATYGLIDQGASIDSVGQFFDAFGGGLASFGSAPSLVTADLGVTYDLTPRLRMMGSFQGLGAAGPYLDRARSLKLDNEIRVDGFYWNTADTGVDFLGNYLDTLTAEFGRTLFVAGQTEALQFKPMQRADAAIYLRSPKKVHQLGIRYLYRSRPTLSYQGLSAEYHGFFGRRWQVSGGYTYTLSSTQAQSHSVTAFTTLHLPAGFSVHLGTSAAHMLPMPMTTATLNQTIGIPSNMDRVNVTVGLNWMIYEKAYRKAAKARREAKRAKKASKKAERAKKKTKVEELEEKATELGRPIPKEEVIDPNKDYYVVLGSFKSKELAEKLARTIGGTAKVIARNATNYRVCVGTFKGSEISTRLAEFRQTTPDAWMLEATVENQ